MAHPTDLGGKADLADHRSAGADEAAQGCFYHRAFHRHRSPHASEALTGEHWLADADGAGCTQRGRATEGIVNHSDEIVEVERLGEVVLPWDEFVALAEDVRRITTGVNHRHAGVFFANDSAQI